MIVADGFFEDPEAVRNYVSRLEFSREGFYPGRSVVVPDASYFCAKVSELLGATFWLAHPEYAAFRLALDGEELQVGVHSDDFRQTDGLGVHGQTHWSVVVNLSRPGLPESNSDALAFYYDRKLQRSTLMEHEPEARSGGRNGPVLDTERYSQLALVPWRSNRCVVFASHSLHSQVGKVGYGSSFEDGRLVLVMFGYTGAKP